MSWECLPFLTELSMSHETWSLMSWACWHSWLAWVWTRKNDHWCHGNVCHSWLSWVYYKPGKMVVDVMGMLAFLAGLSCEPWKMVIDVMGMSAIPDWVAYEPWKMVIDVMGMWAFLAGLSMSQGKWPSMSCKVPKVLLGPFKSLEIDFWIKGLLNPFIQPMGPFCLSGGPFHCCEFL